MRPLRVAFVALGVRPHLRGEGRFAGGAERQQVILARALRALGAEVSFVSVRADEEGPRDDPALGGFPVFGAYRSDAGVPVLRFVHPRLTGLWAALGRAAADVYYQRCAGMLTGVVGAYCRRHRRGFVFASAHLSDCDPALLPIRNPRDRALYFLGLRRAGAVVAQTREQRELFRSRLGVEALVLPNVEPHPEAAPIGPETPRRHLLWVGSLQPWKRPEWFLDLARAMPAREFVMAGGATPRGERYGKRVAALASRAPNVSFLGPVPPDRIPSLARSALMLVSTSEAEGFPNTTLEAWSAGAPVYAATDPDGCIVESGGGRVDPTFAGLSAAINSALEDPARLRSEGERGRAHLERHHDPATVAAKLLDVLDRAAAAAGRRSLDARPRVAESV